MCVLKYLFKYYEEVSACDKKAWGSQNHEHVWGMLKWEQAKSLQQLYVLLWARKRSSEDFVDKQSQCSADVLNLWTLWKSQKGLQPWMLKSSESSKPDTTRGC